jgi:toxin ParE1/3/4
LKPSRLRPQASRDREAAVRYYRKEAGPTIAKKFVAMSEVALDQIEAQPGIGSPILGKALGITALRSWRVTDFPVLWFYFERIDHVDIVRLLGERRDIATIFSDER